MMSLWDALRMNMMISYQELVRTFLSTLRKTQKAAYSTCRLSEQNVGMSNHLNFGSI
ncbi:hypothetical protein HmCmsJML149_03066 [Escherichia coli]|nr:hypothetical protein HmCmsJML149_03066 [Escherichia coli]